MSCYLYIFVLYTVYVCIGKISSTSTHLKSNGTVDSIVKSHANFNFYFLSRLFETIHWSFSTWNGLYPMWLLFVCLLIFCCCSLVCNVCPMDAWWFFLFETGFHAFGVQSVNKLCTSPPKKKTDSELHFMTNSQALHFDTYDNCVEIFAYMKEFCFFLSRSLMLYIFIFRISFICGCCSFFLVNLRQHLGTKQT